MIEDFRQEGESLAAVAERVADLALPADEFRRKQNAKAIKQLRGMMGNRGNRR